MFRATHIQPSHRRMPHVLWTDSMTLIWNLLMGGRMGRYTGSPDTLVLDQRVTMEDSQCRDQRQAGGNCLPTAIAGHTTGNSCSPSFALRVGSSMCVEAQLDLLQIRYTYVRTEGPAYKEHFGANEHSYSHWLSLDLPAGWWDLARLLFMHPDAASAAKRDATPYDYFRGSVFVWNRLWRSSLKIPCFISPPQKR